jgi:hypothetical protein
MYAPATQTRPDDRPGVPPRSAPSSPSVIFLGRTLPKELFRELVETILSSVVFRNMSSEQKPQPGPQPESPPGSPPRPRRRPAGAADPRPPGPGPDGAPSAKEVARALGYDPDEPATWPGGEQQPPASESAPLTDPLAMRALAHPVRVALVELLRVVDTLTATQASELLGESPANCAFHLRTLAKYGLVQEAGGGRGRERPWKAAERHIAISTTQADPRAAAAAGALGRAWLDLWIDRARQVFGSEITLPGWESTTGWSRTAVFLTPEETADLRRQMRRLLEKYEPRKSDPALRPPGALPVEWTVFNAPVAELVEFAEAQEREAQTREAQEREAGERPGDPGQDPEA